jgi:dTDP-4-amino-4,6-dideoxygalactose transaminase
MTGGELSRLAGVLDRNFINDGPLTREFEERIAQRTGTRHAVAVTSGVGCDLARLDGERHRPGDEVIVPDLTFIASANAVAWPAAPRYWLMSSRSVSRSRSTRSSARSPHGPAPS